MEMKTVHVRCRKCRNDLTISSCIDNRCVNSRDSILYLVVENAPDWVLSQVNLANWVKGKLTCEKCGGRLGSFDFTNIRKCQLCKEHNVSAVHILQNRVDVIEQKPRNTGTVTRSSLHQFNNDSLLATRSNTVEQLECGSNSLQNVFDGAHMSVKPRHKSENNVSKVHVSECEVYIQHDESFDIEAVTNLSGQSHMNSPFPDISNSAADVRDMCKHGDAISDILSATETNFTRENKKILKKMSPELSASNNTDDTVEERIKTGLIGKEQTYKEQSHTTIGNELAGGSAEINYTVHECLSLLGSVNQEFTVLEAEGKIGEKNVHTDFSVDSLSDTGNMDQVLERPGSELIDWRRRRKNTNNNRNQNPYSVLLSLQDSKNNGASVEKASKKEKNPEKKIKAVSEKETLPETVVLEDDYCAICLELYYRPHQVVPCKHTFCETCLRLLARERPSVTLCPLCRHVIRQCIYDADLDSALKEKYVDLYKQRRHHVRKITNKFYALPECSELQYKRALEREIQVQRNLRPHAFRGALFIIGTVFSAAVWILVIVLLVIFILYLLFWWLFPLLWNAISSFDTFVGEWSGDMSNYDHVNFHVYNLFKLMIHGWAWYNLYHQAAHYSRWHHYMVFLLHGYSAFQINLFRTSVITVIAELLSRYIVRRARIR